MKNRKAILLFTFFIFINKIHTQSIYKIYFEYGKSSPKSDQIEKFNHWFNQFDFSQIDSIVLVGFADSVGKFENNLKLSLKRTEYIHKHIKKKYPTTRYDIKEYGKGEKIKKIEDKDRRVEIKVYLKVELIEELDSTGVELTINKCYIIDHEMLQAVFVSYVLIKNKRFVKLYIEKEDFLKYKKTAYFYITNESSKTTLHKIKWKSSKSGVKSFERQRYEAFIPLDSYLKNKIVYYEPKSCDSCFKDTLIGVKYIGKNSCMADDIFLNRNVEWKPRLFNPYKISIRVPKMFTDSSLTYYNIDRQAIVWKIKKRKPEYLFTVFKTNATNGYSYFSKIYRKMPCCNLKHSDSKGFICGGTWEIIKSSFNIELGVNRLKKENVPYIGFAYLSSYSGYESRVLLGIDTLIRPILNIKIQKSIFEFPCEYLFPSFYKWRKGSNYYNIYDFPAEIYFGTESRFGFNVKNNGFADQNTFAGIRVCARRHQIFIQKGIAYRYYGQYASSLYSSFQIGYHFLIYKIN